MEPSATGRPDDVAAAVPELMAHGYTHLTSRLGDVVTKQYRGPDASARCAREAAVLAAVGGVLPVPPVIAAGPACLQTMLVPGVHGQELIAAGLAGPVLAACGRMLRRIHQLSVPPELSRGPSSPGAVLVHGDYGPNNVLLDARAGDITAVLDWEWAHAGDSVEDLAWCEFIIRLHHPDEVWALGAFYDSYQARPAWPDLHDAIIERCCSMLELCERWEPDGPGVASWTERLAKVRTWTQ